MAILVKSKTPKSDKNRWATTWEAFQDGQALYGKPFALDVCAEPETAKVGRFYVSPEWFDNNRLSNFGLAGHKTFQLSQEKKIVGIDALAHDWDNDWWCNPPFDLKQVFIRYATEQARQGRSGMMMIPHEPLTGWWRQLVEGQATAVYLPDGRYPFYEIDGVTKKDGVNFGSCFVLFTPHVIKETIRVPFTRYFATEQQRVTA